MSSVETSHGKRRARTPRPGENPAGASTVMAGPYKDATTGRFLKGNTAARLRGLKRAPKLATLNAGACAEWVRPFVTLARTEAAELAAEVGADRSASLLGLVEDAATAMAMHRAYMAQAVAPDVAPVPREAALQEARSWLREHRQCLLALRAEARAGLPTRADSATPHATLAALEPA